MSENDSESRGAWYDINESSSSCIKLVLLKPKEGTCSLILPLYDSQHIASVFFRSVLLPQVQWQPESKNDLLLNAEDKT